MFFRHEGEGIRCTLCPHQCLIPEQSAGYCGVRRRNGAVLETAAGTTAVAHWDAIEKKPFYHFRPGSAALTIGGSGCSLACSYCQNYRLSQFGRSAEAPWREVALSAESLIQRAAERDGILAMSYSEPSLAAEFTIELSRLGRSAGVELIWKTNGFMTAETLETVVPHLAAVNLDVKAASEQAHARLTGGSLAPVLHALRFLAASDIWLEVSTPIIPGVNDDADSIRRIAEHIAAAGRDIPWHLIRFVPEYRLSDRAPAHPDVLASAALIAKQAGLRYVYIETALGADARTTRCGECGDEVVTREKWGVVRIRLVEGQCPRCGVRIPGRWGGA